MFARDHYLLELKKSIGNNLIKIITGVRRSGKSFLLNNIFKNYLINELGVKRENIIQFAFDSEEDIAKLDKYLPDQPTTFKVGKQTLVSNRKFMLYVNDIVDDSNKFYFLLDEIQNLDGFVRVLNGYLRHSNFDIFVTGSNSHLLSSEVDTEFSGRGDRIHLLPLTFKEYLTGVSFDNRTALDEYIRYGGIPLVQLKQDDVKKSNEAKRIYKETYLSDVKNRHSNVDINKLDDTLNVVASMISTRLNPPKIAKTFHSVYNIDICDDTINNYINWFEEAYLLNKVYRYDIKGRKYIGSPYKIYFEDIGIRNAILNFRDVDETDIIENVVYNELRYRGFNVDVGVVYIKAKTDRKDKNGKTIYTDKETEVDFVANKGNKTYYIQVSLEINSQEKKNQEYESIRNIPDSFKKVIITKDQGLYYYTNEGFLRISLIDFLLNLDSLDW